MAKIIVHQNEKIKKLGDLYGIFFEDINHAADGGLYAELIQNRSFEFDPIDRKEYHGFTAWEKIQYKGANATFTISQEEPLNEENKNYLIIDIKDAGEGVGICNTGFEGGIPIEKGEDYLFSIFCKKQEGMNGEIAVILENERGEICAKQLVKIEDTCWKKYEVTLTPTQTTSGAKLLLVTSEKGQLAIDMVSLFPKDTFKGRKNGLRKDIAQMLEAMTPKFMRFPGGCLIHDGSLNDHDRNSMYRWKRTLGKIEERPTWKNNWGYNQTLGLGYYEYFCFCEDIRTKPLPIIPAGYNPHKSEAIPLDELQPWIDDALDLIEFANGEESTIWGKKRIELGHTKPFNLEYIGIGNEEIGDAFFERYPYFHQAIKAKYPNIQVINTSGPFASGEGYDAGWASAKEHGSDYVDEHYYQSPEWFLANMHRYDTYDPKGPKVFLGEYATWGNTYKHALIEAGYMTHLEKAPAVGLACYAPMLCNVNYINWKPDMIWFNNHQVYGTPNYYVQKLFMNHQGDQLLKTEIEGLSQKVILKNADALQGEWSIAGNDVTGKVWDIAVTNLETGETNSYPSFAVDNENHPISTVPYTHYKLEMRFKRFSGRKGLKIFFGGEDPSNTFLWEFGGWDNFDCNITSFNNGKASTLSHRIFNVADIEYALCLVVEGRKITTYVNGELYNQTEHKLPEIEELYVTASLEEKNQDTIVKVVNLMEECKEVTIELNEWGNVPFIGKAYELAGYEDDAENSFQYPDKVIPIEKPLNGNEGVLTYVFKPRSVTVLRLQLDAQE